MSDAASPAPRDSHAAQRANRGWFIALGIALLVLGVVAFLDLLLASVVTVYGVGFLMLLGGVVQVVHAFQVRSCGGFACGSRAVPSTRWRVSSPSRTPWWRSPS